jgi:hypothetical protein
VAAPALRNVGGTLSERIAVGASQFFGRRLEPEGPPDPPRVQLSVSTTIPGGVAMIPRTDDPTMELMRRTAERLGPPPALPPSLDGATLREANENRTTVVKAVGNAIDADLRPVQNAAADPYDLPPQLPVFAGRLLQDRAIDQLTTRVLPDVPELRDRLNIVLRLTAGYLDAAKVIAGSTRAETNNAQTRQRDIPIVEARAASDPIYAAGVEAAPHYKHRDLGQDIFRDGIPDGSIVLRDWYD